MTLAQLIQKAESILPGEPAPDDELDPRWQAIIDIAQHCETHPEELWSFTARWGCHENEDLRAAIATCLLEHLLPSHFRLIFPRVEKLANENKLFAKTFSWCGWFGNDAEDERQFRELQDRIERRPLG